MTMPPYRPDPRQTPGTVPPGYRAVNGSVLQASRPADPKANGMGMVSILLAMVNLVVMLASAGFSGQAYVTMIKIAGKDFDSNDPSVQPYMARVGVCLIVAAASWLVSLIPFILGILGTRRPPRGMGITAIVLAMLTPVLGIVAWCFFVVPAMMNG